ncbi:hypothetical protein H5410_013040 [Solanum commersonii]|uniref:Uncharacterized protein n=1 Tax=Solanum commersonii TaxID=4109 RepID=A0A9J6ATE1_SOLCO|nr:hypothetical protein H5410_013040 [Solanum commersonii]
MKFNSEEESYNAYNSYALAKGFGIQKSAKTYNINKEVTRRYLYQARVEITKHQSELYGGNCDKTRHKFDSSVDPFIGAKDRILDPIKKKGKGNGFSKMKPKGEKKKKKTSQVTFKSKAGQKHVHEKTMNFDIQSTSMQQVQHESMGLSFELHGDSFNIFPQFLTQNLNSQSKACNLHAESTIKQTDI